MPRGCGTLAGQQGFVDLGRAAFDHAIRRQDLAGADLHAIADLQRGDRNGLHRLGAIGDAPAGGRQLPHQRLGAGRCALPRAQFQIARRQQESDEHRHRIEVGFAVAAHHGGHARGKGRADAERHRHVHADMRVPHLAPRIAEDRPGGEQDDRCGQRETGPLHQHDLVRRDAAAMQVDRPRIHHHLHHAQHGDAQTDQQLAPLARLGRAARGRLVRPRLVADVGDGGEQVGEPDRTGIGHDAHALRRVVDDGLAHTGHARQRAFDEPHAGGAAHAGQGQRHLFGAILARADEALAHDRQVVCRPRGFGLGAYLAVDGPCEGDRPVVDVAHARRVQRHGDGLAAGTAEVAGLAGHLGMQRGIPIQ